jgi:hypothetical protein
MVGQGEMLQTFMESTTYKNLYGIVLPTVVMLFLLVGASLDSRPKLFGSSFWDIGIRSLLTIWFCILYITLSRISSFRYYPNQKWTKADVGPVEKYFYWIMIIFFGVMCGIGTYWAIRWFFPDLRSFASVIGAINSLVIVLPLVTHYWVLKL